MTSRARHNIDHRYPGTTQLERWCYVRDTLQEAVRIAEGEGVTLAPQNHTPIITNHEQMMELIHEVDSPALKACLDAPLMHAHSETAYREAVRACQGRLVHSHYGGRFERLPSDRVVRATLPGAGYAANDVLFAQAAREKAGFTGHYGYELCSPVTTGHRHEGLAYALTQAELAAAYMHEVEVIDSI